MMKKNNPKLKRKGIVLLLLLFFTAEIYAGICGDVDLNGKVDIVDALKTAQFYVGLNPPGFEQGVADVDGDNWVTIIDALQIAQYYVGLINTFPGCTPIVNPADALVVVFIIDGMEPVTASTAAANGAENLKMVIEQGVTVTEAYCVSPAADLVLPDGSKPWGSSSPPNVAIHTGCHVFETRAMDDIFLAARDSGVLSIFAGGASNYTVFDTADFHYAGNFSDADTVARAIQHIKKDGVRLIRLHLQRIRDAWNGPQGKTDPKSAYIKAVINADIQLGLLINELKAANVWEKTYLIVAADHGMGNSSASNHPPRDKSSWEIFMGFYGPGIRKGETIPYAESPDIAVLTIHLLGLRPLQGHTGSEVTIKPKTTTATLLTNIFTGAPAALDHPRLIKRYLESENFKPQDDYLSYRARIIALLAQ